MASKKSLLDLVPAGPVRSPIFIFRKQSARWRLLDSLEIIACRTAGRGRAMDVLIEDHGLEKRDAFELVQAGTSGDTEREWFEYYVIAAAMTDEDGSPISVDTPDDIAQRLMDTTAPIERGRLIEDYMQFADEHDPSTLKDGEFEEVLDEVGKGAGESIWKRRGSNSLRSLLAIMAPRLIAAEAALAELQEAESLEARIEALELAISPTSRSADGSDSPPD